MVLSLVSSRCAKGSRTKLQFLELTVITSVAPLELPQGLEHKHRDPQNVVTYHD